MQLTILLLIVLIRPSRLGRKPSWTSTRKLIFIILIQKVLNRANNKIKIGKIGAIIVSKIIEIPERIKQITINNLNLLSLT